MARTVLEIAQNAAPKIGIAAPSLLYGNTDATAVELRAVIQEAAERIVRAHDWALLKVEQTYSGDGVTEGFDLPSDYLRMPKDTRVWSTRWQRPLMDVTADDWVRLDIRNYDLVTGTWIILGGQMKFRPELAVGEDAKWLYISDKAVRAADTSTKAHFTADEDVFLLGARLLELQAIWEWRNRKGLPYEEDMRTAEIALAQAIGDDKGARMVVQSSRRTVHGKVAYPWSIEP